MKKTRGFHMTLGSVKPALKKSRPANLAKWRRVSLKENAAETP